MTIESLAFRSAPVSLKYSPNGPFSTISFTRFARRIVAAGLCPSFGTEHLANARKYDKAVLNVMEHEEISDPSVVTLPKMLIHEHLRDTERPSILGAIKHLRRMDSIKKALV
jgi:hypothetical protein